MKHKQTVIRSHSHQMGVYEQNKKSLSPLDTKKWIAAEVEHVCTTTNLPLSNGIKIVSVLQRLYREIGRAISDVQKRDEQTDRQTKNSTFLATPAAGEIRAPPNLTW